MVDHATTHDHTTAAGATPTSVATPFDGPGEMRARCRATDWSRTPLGPVDAWPVALRSAAQVMLATGLPAALLWGRSHALLYNDACAAILRDRHPLALGLPLGDAWPGLRDALAPVLARVMAGRTVTQDDERHALDRVRDGNGWATDEAWLTASYGPVLDDAGAVGGVLAIVVETTQRVRERRLAAAMAASEARQAFLVRLSDALRPLEDPVEVKAAAMRTLGEHLGVDHAYYVEVAPDDEHVVCESDWTSGGPSLVGRYELASFGPTLAAEYRAGRTFVIDDTHADPRVPEPLRSAWESIGVRAQAAVPLVKGGRFTAALGVDQAVPRAWTPDEVALLEQVAERTWAAVERARAEAALREREGKYRQIFDAIDEGLCIIEVLLDDAGRPADYRFLEVNRQFEEQTGLRAAVGRTARELVPTLEAHWFETYGRIARTGRPERFEQGSDAMGRWFDVFAFRIGAPEERRVGILFKDVSAARAAAGERERLLGESLEARRIAEEARVEAERANRAKGEFLAVMSHELRTPLNAIGGYAELIELGIHGPVTDAQRAALERIQRSQRHLLGLISGVLNYARVEAGAVRYAVEEVALDELLATCEALVVPQARARGLALRYGGCGPRADGSPLVVRADRDKVQQVVLNLLGNAVKFTEPGGEVVLTCDAGEARDDEVRIQVRDTGVGMTPEQLARAFEPFVQLDASLTRTRDGVGLGLAISRDLARGMGGDLTAESAPGAGSTFTFVLPTGARPAAERVPPPAASPPV